jgi:type I restriction-modification system DNA methylase subunit
MTDATLNWIPNFIWGTADDELRDLNVRGKYRDVIMPMTVVRRLDAVLEPTRAAVLAMKERLNATGLAFYNTPLPSGSATCARERRFALICSIRIMRQNETEGLFGKMIGGNN